MIVQYSRKAEKAITNGIISEEHLNLLLYKFIDKIQGKEVNLDCSKLSGKWKSYFRIRSGRLRIIFYVNFNEKIFYIERIDDKKNVYNPH